MATSLDLTTIQANLTSIVTRAGSTASVWVWTGNEPAKSGTSFVEPTGNLLASGPLANPIGTVSGVTLTFSAIASMTGLNTGTPGYYRVTTLAPFTLTAAAISGSTVTLTGTITGGGSSAYAGAIVWVSGFANAGNNGVFTVTSSSGTTLVFTNASGVAETHAGSAVLDTASNVCIAGTAGVGNFAAPTGFTATPSTTGGTFTAGTYYYKITTLTAAGETTGSLEQSAMTTGSMGSVALAWTAVTNATGYRIYRAGTSGGETGTGSLVTMISSGTTAAYTDTGAATTTGSVPASNTAGTADMNFLSTIVPNAIVNVTSWTFTGGNQ